MPGRGIGIVYAFEKLFPNSIRELFTLVTQLGDVWFLFGAVALLYWFSDRRQGAFVLAAILGALSLTLALKGLFALPRPPEAVRIGYASGYGFPSGHAIGTTVGWGLFALVLERGHHHLRAAVAGSVVVIVSASRVIIGVHYAVDVVVGVLVGLAYLAVLLYATGWSPNRGFAAASVLALAAVATSGLQPDAVALVGGVLGGGATWAAFDAPPQSPIRRGVAVGGLAVLAVFGYAGHALALPLAAVFALNAMVPAGVLALPLVVERVKGGGSATPT